MLVLPLMSCGARLPIWMLLIPAFFSDTWRAPALFGIYMVGIILALALALVLRRTIFRGDEAPFVMELPPYRLPTFRAVVMRMAERSMLYLRKAGTIILGISVLMWALTSYPPLPDDETAMMSEAAEGVSQENLAAAGALTHSLAGRIGRAIEPVITPLGFDWKIGVALIGAFAAKEVFVSQMGVIYAVGERGASSESLGEAIRRDYPPHVGFSLMLFLLISAPCMATIAVTRRESGSWRWALFQLFGLTAVAYILSFIVFQVGQFFI
jgi:ferrous iron transport protein B